MTYSADTRAVILPGPSITVSVATLFNALQEVLVALEECVVTDVGRDAAAQARSHLAEFMNVHIT